MHNEDDFKKEKIQLKLLLRYQKQDLRQLLMQLPGEFIALGLEQSFPNANKHSLFQKATHGIRMLLGGAINKLSSSNEHQHSIAKNSFLSKLSFFSTLGKAYRRLRRLKTIKTS